MKKILNITSSIMGEASQSIKLSNVIIEKLLAVYPNSKVQTIDLAKNPFPHLNQETFLASRTPSETLTDKQKEALTQSNQAVKELMEADIIILGVPLYNFGIPSNLKAWMDHIVRAGITFKYDNGRPQGLVTGKKLYLAVASGGVYSDGPMKAYDFTEPYLRATLGFIGMTDITTFRVEGLMMPDQKEIAIAKAVDSVEEHFLAINSL